MTDSKDRQVAIIGGGTAGWMTAAALARFLPRGTRITLVESDAIGTVGVGEATIPQIRLFNQSLGIDEATFVRATQGSFKLGIEFVDWSGPGSRYIHAFGSIGRGLGLVPFHHYWLRARAESLGTDTPVGSGETPSLWAYSPSAGAAAADRFAPDPGRADLPSGLSWAYQFDAGLYAAFLRRYAEDRGVVRIEGQVAHVALDGESQAITVVTLDDGRTVSADLYIDCSGFRGLLIEQALQAGYDDWSHLLPCDRALAVPTASTTPLSPYTRATARTAGWQWRIPLQHRTGNGLVYASAFLDDGAAQDLLLGNLDAAQLAEPRPLRFTTGKRRHAWIGNCVAIGLAAGFMEPLESTSIHLIQSAIARLIALFPAAAPNPVDIAEYNRQTDREWLAVRDFLVLHYRLNGRDEPLWRACREAPIPDRLAHRIELFRSNGRIFREDDELFTEVAWLQVMLGQGVVPAGYHPLADGLSQSDLAEFLSLARTHAEQVVARMPSHAVFIAAHCAASPFSATSPFPKAAA